MTLRDDRERAAWSSAWDAVVFDGATATTRATAFADEKILAMREREAKPVRIPTPFGPAPTQGAGSGFRIATAPAKPEDRSTGSATEWHPPGVTGPIVSGVAGGVFPPSSASPHGAWGVIKDSRWEGAWRAEMIDPENEGCCYVTIFSGPNSRARAEEYAAWKNASVRRERKGLAELPDVLSQFRRDIAAIPPDDGAEIDELIQAAREQMMRYPQIDRARLARAIDAVEAKRGAATQPAAAQPEAPVRGERERLERLRDRIRARRVDVFRPDNPGVAVDSVISVGGFDTELSAALAALPSEPEPAPEPSQRGALERIKASCIFRMSLYDPCPPDFHGVIREIDAELSRQPPDDRAEVDALIEAARKLRDNASSMQRYADLCGAISDLDRVRGGGK